MEAAKYRWEQTLVLSKKISLLLLPHKRNNVTETNTKPLWLLVAHLCLINHVRTWTTTRWELEHWSVQGGIKPTKTNSDQAKIFLINIIYMIWYSCQNSSREEPSQLWFWYVARNLANCISIKLIYQYQIVCRFVVFKIFSIGPSNSFYCPSGIDIKYPLLSVLLKWAHYQTGFWTISWSVRI